MTHDKRAAWPWFGWLLFLGLIGHCVASYGTRWTLGRYGMPTALIAPDGLHYLDGAEIDPINLALIEADCQEEFMLVMLGLLATLLTILFFDLRKLRRLQMSIEQRRLRSLCSDSVKSD